MSVCQSRVGGCVRVNDRAELVTAIRAGGSGERGKINTDQKTGTKGRWETRGRTIPLPPLLLPEGGSDSTDLTVVLLLELNDACGRGHVPEIAF